MSVISDVFFGGAEKKAGKAQAAAQTQAIAEGRRQFDLTRQDFAPGIQAGNQARDQLLNFLGLNGTAAEQKAISGFQESPGQAFLRQRAERSLLRNASATGGLRGGNVLTALQEQGIGLSNQFLGERLNRLAGVASGGNASVANQAGIGANLTAGIQNAQVGRGAARASGILGQAAGIRRGLGQVAGAFT